MNVIDRSLYSGFELQNPHLLNPLTILFKRELTNLVEWIKTTQLVIHGGFAVHFHLNDIDDPFPKGSIDCYATDEAIEGIKSSYLAIDARRSVKSNESTREVILLLDEQAVIRIELLLEEIQTYDTVKGLRMLPIVQSISIYWALINGHQLMAYNTRLFLDYTRLMKIACVLKRDNKLPEPYVLSTTISDLETGIDIAQLPSCWYAGEHALAMLQGNSDPLPSSTKITIASFDKPTEIVDLLIEKYGYEHGEFYLSPNWSVMPNWFELVNKEPNIRVLDCSTISGRALKNKPILSLLTIAAVQANELSLRILSTIYQCDGVPSIIGDTPIGKGIAGFVMHQIFIKSNIDRRAYTTNIEYLNVSVAKLLESGE